MTRRNVPEAFQYLFGLEHFGIKFGLTSVRSILDAIGHPERAYRSLHIAGTNGKGSVTAMVDAALRAAGHRSARYTSPHLIALNERFVVDGRPASDNDIVVAIDEVRGAIDRLRADGVLEAQPTFFEVTTAAAFALFRRAGVDVAVFEVGLGGRLDATNVITPVATAITSIAFDHQQYLGTTLRDIAGEKAGIVKPGVPVVVGELPEEALAVVEQIANERGAELVHAGPVLPPAYSGVQLALRGAHQVRNAAVAVHLLETAHRRGVAVPHDAIVSGLTDVRWPGRLDLRHLDDGRELLLDAAHNADGAAALAAFLRTWNREPGASGKPPLVFAAMRDKAVEEMLKTLLPEVGALVATRAANPRSAEPADLAAAARSIAPELSIDVEPVRLEALKRAWERSRRIVVAGSIFLLGDVLAELGLGT
jgi:dihydrofolate synthase / folylpolyglutamate synthase